jgi:hypothetical protein
MKILEASWWSFHGFIFVLLTIAIAKGRLLLSSMPKARTSFGWHILFSPQADGRIQSSIPRLLHPKWSCPRQQRRQTLLVSSS